MLLVYPKFYFLPIVNEINRSQGDGPRDIEEIEVMASKNIVSNNEDNYKKLLEEIDEEFISEVLNHNLS